MYHSSCLEISRRIRRVISANVIEKSGLVDGELKRKGGNHHGLSISYKLSGIKLNPAKRKVTAVGF